MINTRNGGWVRDVFGLCGVVRVPEDMSILDVSMILGTSEEKDFLVSA